MKHRRAQPHIEAAAPAAATAAAAAAAAAATDAGIAIISRRNDGQVARLRCGGRVGHTRGTAEQRQADRGERVRHEHGQARQRLVLPGTRVIHQLDCRYGALKHREANAVEALFRVGADAVVHALHGSEQP